MKITNMILRYELSFFSLLLWIFIVPISQQCVRAGKLNNHDDHPHIVFILTDDLGFNDVGFHGSLQIPTPNLDALAFTGLILNNYYVTPLCTPSRSALMTGKYPIHTGMQHNVIFAPQPYGLPLSEKLLPEYLKNLGYAAHIVGKWHLGHYKREYTPLYRGFDSHFGYWTGHKDYYDHTAIDSGMWGYDLRRGVNVSRNEYGNYTTRLFAREAVNVIRSHNTSQPLFLYLAHLGVHSANPYSPLQAPAETVEKFAHIADKERRKYAAMVYEVDQSVGAVVEALRNQNMLKNTIIIFSSDNGGPAAGFNLNAASNWPLKGVKNTPWEGGIRAAGMVWAPAFFNQSGRVATQLIDVTDWLPTLYEAAGGDIADLGDIDGVSQWDVFINDGPAVRDEIVHNIDPLFGYGTVRKGVWKLVNGTTYNGDWDDWYGPSGRNGSDWESNFYLSVHDGIENNLVEDEDIMYRNALRGSPVGHLLNEMGIELPDSLSVIREAAVVDCAGTKPDNKTCNPLKAPCLFNILEDPCEYFNLAEQEPAVYKEMLAMLQEYEGGAVAPINVPSDPAGNPKYWDYTWTNWLDV